MTVCQSARCPNIYDCFSRRRCTFLLLGPFCTRRCAFCAVEKANDGFRQPDKEEISRMVRAIGALGIREAVVTSVTRDDLVDGGAAHFAEAIRHLRDFDAEITVEVLVPDFLGNEDSIKKVIFAEPDVFSHNVETVPRLYDKVRPRADYKRSIEVLRAAKGLREGVVVKSGLMVGLGETREEIYRVMEDLKSAGCDAITIGQYLKPDKDCLDVEEFLEPENFERFAQKAKDMGFKKYSCGPFVRSSYEEGVCRN